MSVFFQNITKVAITARSMAIVLCALLATMAANAQTDAQLTQYWAMPTYYSPGAVGNSDYIRITAASRLQWVGIPKAPKEFLGLADSPFKVFGKRIGASPFSSGEMSQSSLGVSVCPSSGEAHLKATSIWSPL